MQLYLIQQDCSVTLNRLPQVRLAKSLPSSPDLNPPPDVVESQTKKRLLSCSCWTISARPGHAVAFQATSMPSLCLRTVLLNNFSLYFMFFGVFLNTPNLFFCLTFSLYCNLFSVPRRTLYNINILMFLFLFISKKLIVFGDG